MACWAPIQRKARPRGVLEPNHLGWVLFAIGGDQFVTVDIATGSIFLAFFRGLGIDDPMDDVEQLAIRRVGRPPLWRASRSGVDVLADDFIGPGFHPRVARYVPAIPYRLSGEIVLLTIFDQDHYTTFEPLGADRHDDQNSEQGNDCRHK